MSQVLQKNLKALSALIFSVFALVIIATLPSKAGLKINIGMSKGDVVRILSSKGYSQIKVYDTGFKTGKAYACRNGLKYNIKVDKKGRIKGEAKIGSCRNQVNQEQVRRNLQANGFSRIVIDEQNSNYIALACKGRQRIRLIISQQGELLKRRSIGNCRNSLAPNDVRQVLRDKGYNRIEFIDRQLPRYVAEACFEGRKLELLINQFGEVEKQRRLGRCNPPINANNLVNVMREKGYDRVSIISQNPPRYQLEACAENVRFNVTLNQYGKITERSRVGECNTNVDQKQIVQLLRQEGFTRINIKQRQNGNFRVSACLDGYEKRIKLNRYGELLEEVDGQQCASRSVREVSDNLNGRGFKKAAFYAEACRNGNKIKITLNQYGDDIGRERIGRC